MAPVIQIVEKIDVSHKKQGYAQQIAQTCQLEMPGQELGGQKTEEQPEKKGESLLYHPEPGLPSPRQHMVLGGGYDEWKGEFRGSMLLSRRRSLICEQPGGTGENAPEASASGLS